MKTIGGKLRTTARTRLRPPPKQVDSHYTTPEHRAWSKAVIARAGGCCQMCGRSGARLYADHIVELQDGGAPFDMGNGQAICGSCHSTKSAAERRHRAIGPDVAAHSHPDWLRPSLVPLTVVCGPPASGKSRYVAEHAGPRDLVIDLDLIAVRLSGQPIHDWDRSWLSAAIRERNDMLGSLSDGRCRRAAAWLIVGEPSSRWRQWWADKLRPVRIVVLETPDEVCCARLSDRSGERKQHQSAAVYRWWADYERRDGDVVVSYHEAMRSAHG